MTDAERMACIEAWSSGSWGDRLGEIVRICIAVEKAVSHPPAPTQREHITDGSPCWCSPDLDYVDPETGAKVWIHKESQ